MQKEEHNMQKYKYWQISAQEEGKGVMKSDMTGGRGRLNFKRKISMNRRQESESKIWEEMKEEGK